MSQDTPNARAALSELIHRAAQAVAAVRAGRSLTVALEACPAPLRPGAQALAFHTLRRLGGALAVRAVLAPRTPPPELEALLCVALALLWPRAGDDAAIDAPVYDDHTAVDQAVAAVKRREARSAGFANAVLRRFVRERDALVAQVGQMDVQARWQHPRWWVERLRTDWPEHWQALLSHDDTHAPMALRVNARQSDAPAYLARLAAAGIAARHAGAQAVVLERARPVTALPGWDDGAVSVQDLSAQQAAPLLLGEGDDRLRDGARVLDACAAPGGKTAHLLELATLDLLALDSDAARLRRVDDSLRRLGLAARTAVGDAGVPAAWWDGRPFDAILLDAPCSASGIVRRHPDVRWLRRATDLEALAATQARLLEALWPLLAPGGRLVYATCSVFRVEGAQQIEVFLQRHPEAIHRPSPGHWLGLPDNAPQGSSPMPAGGDGFFFARLDKPS